MTNTQKVFEDLLERFKSGNYVPVSSVTLTKPKFDAIYARYNQLTNEVKCLTEELMSLTAVVKVKDEALMLQVSHMEMYSLQISHANDYAKITKAIDLKPQDVELVEVGDTMALPDGTLSDSMFDVTSTVDCSPNLCPSLQVGIINTPQEVK